MIYTIDLLDKTQIDHINKIFDISDFSDGSVSASYSSDKIKNNLQLEGYEHTELIYYMCDILNRSNDYRQITLCKSFNGMLFCKYEKGMYYHSHLDDYSSGQFRTDYSTTVFLNSPDEYEGGELCLKVGNQDLLYKLDAGKCLVYPTGLMHEVKEVKSGVRKVCVFWSESCIQDKDIRSIISDFNCMWSKYSDEALEKMGRNFYNELLNVKFNLMRKYGNFSGIATKRN
jgi:PKHD-type hydroxylase